MKKMDAQNLYVVLGMQFNSNYYVTNKIISNLNLLFLSATKNYNERNLDRGHEIKLHFEPLAAGLGGHLFNGIVRNIIAADIAIFETSDQNPNVMIEMGIALTWGVKVIPLKKKGCPRLPSDISGQTWIEYLSSASKIIDGQFIKKLGDMIDIIITVKKKLQH